MRLLTQHKVIIMCSNVYNYNPWINSHMYRGIVEYIVLLDYQQPHMYSHCPGTTILSQDDLMQV